MIVAHCAAILDSCYGFIRLSTLKSNDTLEHQPTVWPLISSLMLTALSPGHLELYRYQAGGEII